MVIIGSYPRHLRPCPTHPSPRAIFGPDPGSHSSQAIFRRLFLSSSGRFLYYHLRAPPEIQVREVLIILRDPAFWIMRYAYPLTAFGAAYRRCLRPPFSWE